ncbi:MAG: lipopolysaccharide heptosyltransferase II [Candidatus Omnitrophota bacterium]|jgi:lipopolysaccharide heptosyltransferase II
MINKILIINPFGIGDVLFSVPLLKAIKKKYPLSTITYMCNKRTEGILNNNPSISNIYIFEKDDYRAIWKESRIKCLKKLWGLVSSIRKFKYDVVVDMSLGYIYSLVLAVFAGIRMRVGFNYRARGRFLTHKIDIEGFDKKHVIEYYLGLGKFLDLDLQDKETEIMVSKDDAVWAERFLEEHGIFKEDKICGMIPGCGASWGKDADYRRWPARKFAEVADRILSQYKYKVLIFGDSKEIDLCARVQSEMRQSSILVCGKTTLGQLAALLDKCALVVTNDGGPLHMAIALKKKTVAIFGPVDENIYGPYPPNRRYITVASDEPCRPCYKNFKYVKCETVDCLNNITADKVIAAAEKLIGQN